MINPGSATGAYSTVTDVVKPSFVLMDIDGPKVLSNGWITPLLVTRLALRFTLTMFNCIMQATVYVYELIEGEVKVDKIEFTKASSTAL